MTYPVTELQLAILDILWTEGEASVLDVHDRLRGERRVAQSTVSTLLSRLQERGFVTHREEGRRYLYRAAVAREEIQRSMTAEFVEHTRTLFESDVSLLVARLLDEADASPDAVRQAREILAGLEAREAGND